MTRHDLDLFSLLSGIVLTLIATAALVGVSATVASWVWPTILVAVGVVVVAAALVRSTATDDAAAATADDAGAATADADAAVDPDRTMAMAAARDEVEEADHTTD